MVVEISFLLPWRSWFMGEFSPGFKWPTCFASEIGDMSKGIFR